jgi:hypothetical protein
MRTPNESRAEPVPSRTSQPADDGIDRDLPEPSWYLSSWELRAGLTIIEHDGTTTIPGGLGD